ncbi:hypothetical protein FRB90_005952 [Tulasnella sp. 427]|nr:hypothetical protein FRB90_005952 [Tulasnella sp. 427]
MSAPHGSFSSNDDGAKDWRSNLGLDSTISPRGSVTSDEDEGLAQGAQEGDAVKQPVPDHHAAAGPGRDQTAQPDNVATQLVARPATPPWSPVLASSGWTSSRDAQRFGPDQNHPNTHVQPSSTPVAQSEAGSSANGRALYDTPFSSLLHRLSSPAANSDIDQKPVPRDTKPTLATTPTSSFTNEAAPLRGERLSAATLERPPRRSLRESAQRTTQAVKALLTTKRRRGRKSTTAANSGGPTDSLAPSPQTPQSPRPTALNSETEAITNPVKKEEEMEIEEEEEGKDIKPKPSAKALGKRRRVDPIVEDERDDERGSPPKKPRNVKNLPRRSTPARFDKTEEERTSPNPFLATPKRKREPIDEDYDAPLAGPSKRARSTSNELDARSVPAAFVEPLREPTLVDIPHPRLGSSISSPNPPSFIITIPAGDAPEESSIPPLPTPIPPVAPPTPQPLTRKDARLILRK